MKKILHCIHLQNTPILDQLYLEEALLRTDSRNICLINQGSKKSIVMGISGEPEKLLHLNSVRSDKIPVIKRFSGGGTVIVDENTLFISFLFNKDDLDVLPFPEPLLRWSADLYAKSWKIPHFSLQEQDYAIGNQKCGGNAQYIRKDRLLHHTSFLWDYSEKNMHYLLLPQKRPKYREDRSHKDFLCRLKDFAPSSQTLIDQLKKELASNFTLEDLSISSLFFPPHRKSTHLVDLSDAN